MKLWTIPDKAKAMLVLADSVLSDACRITGKLVKIFDDSDLDLNEAIEMAGEGKAVAGKWLSKK